MLKDRNRCLQQLAVPGQRGWEWQGPDLLPAANSSERCNVPPTQETGIIWPEAAEAFSEKVGGITREKTDSYKNRL